MHPDAVKHFVRLSDLIDQGVLPETAAPRLMAYSYGGHTMLHSFMRSRDELEFKCVTCLQTLTVTEAHPCTGTPEVYETNHIKEVRWQCVACEHQWTAVDGDLCPECLAGPTTGMLDTCHRHLLPETREKWPMLREMNDLWEVGVPVNLIYETLAANRGIPLDDALLLVAEEWWRRMTGVPV